MQRMLAGFCLLLLLAGSAQSGSDDCAYAPCPQGVRIASTAEDRLYGLLMQAPETGYRRLRYRVETAGRVLLGKSPVLAASELAVERIGNGSRRGAHTLLITAEGCGKAPVLMRRVTLRQTSPDYGRRAALTFAGLPLAP